MKVKLLFFLLFVSLSVWSQNTEKTITLLNSETNLPVEDATVFIVKTKQSFLSNSDGVVTFVINGNSNIQITHSSFVSVTVRATTLKQMNTVVYLKSTVNDLDEIIVTKKHPQKILKEIVENSIHKLSVPARLKVYSREFFKLNGKYTYYNDGLMNFQLRGNSSNFKTDILVEQNRSFGLISDEIGADALGYNLNDIMQNYYNFKYLNPVLISSGKKEYDFIIKGYKANDEYNVMLITPLENVDELRDDIRIVYDHKRKIIIEISSFVSPTTIARVKDKSAVGSKNIYKSIFKNIYKYENSNYYLVSSKEEIGFERIDKDKKTDIEVRNYFVTTNFNSRNFTYKDSDVFKDKTLYNKSNVILSDYWNISGLTATEEEKEIIVNLQDREP